MGATPSDVGTSPLKAVVSLDEIANDPDCAMTLPSDAARRLCVRAAAVHAALLAALHGAPERPSQAAPRLIKVDEVARRIGKSRSWVEKHTSDLPPRVRVGRQCNWLESDIEAWIRSRPRWQS
jgi:predicted DNA-binding transcriptional regulator AlpA